MAKKNIVALTVTFSMIAFFIGCEPSKEVAPSLSKEQQDKLNAFGAKHIKDLTPAEQESVVDIVHDYLTNKFDFDKLNNKVCHSTAIITFPNKEECISSRTKCIDELATAKEAYKVPTKAQLTETFKDAELTAADFSIAMSLLNGYITVFDSLDCGASPEQIEKAKEAFKDKLLKEHGKQKFENLERLGKTLSERQKKSVQN